MTRKKWAGPAYDCKITRRRLTGIEHLADSLVRGTSIQYKNQPLRTLMGWAAHGLLLLHFFKMLKLLPRVYEAWLPQL